MVMTDCFERKIGTTFVKGYSDLPPLMTPFVLIADIDNAVMVVTTVVVRINMKPSIMPA